MHIRTSALLSLILVGGFGIIGCASIMNGGTQDVTVTSTPSGATVTIYDRTTFDTVSGISPCTLKLSRKHNHLIAIEKDGCAPISLNIKRRTSNWIYGNIFLFSIPGFLVDRGTGGAYRLEPTTFSAKLGKLGDELPGTRNRELVKFRWEIERRAQAGPPIYPGKLRLTFSIPEGNWFYQRHREKNVSKFGFLGLVTGLEFAPSEEYFYSLRFGAAIDFIIPVPAAYDATCVSEASRAVFVQMQYNRDYYRYTLGGGLHWSYFSSFSSYFGGNFCDIDPAQFEEYDVSGHTLGLSLNVQRRIGKHMSVELNYLPSIFIDDGHGYHLGYSHTAYFAVTYALAIMKR